MKLNVISTLVLQESTESPLEAQNTSSAERLPAKEAPNSSLLCKRSHRLMSANAQNIKKEKAAVCHTSTNKKTEKLTGQPFQAIAAKTRKYKPRDPRLRARNVLSARIQEENQFSAESGSVENLSPGLRS